MDNNFDALIKVRFKTFFEGGRKSPLKGEFYSCPFFVDGKGFDCRMILNGQILQLGEWYECPVKFLFLEKISPLLVEGKAFSLWEGKEVANGTVLKIYKKSPT